jgi:hypothetical protein
MSVLLLMRRRILMGQKGWLETLIDWSGFHLNNNYSLPVGTYRIELKGAKGGNSPSRAGGQGGAISVQFSVNVASVVSIACGDANNSNLYGDESDRGGGSANVWGPQYGSGGGVFDISKVGSGSEIAIGANPISIEAGQKVVIQGGNKALKADGDNRTAIAVSGSGAKAEINDLSFSDFKGASGK